MLTIPDESACSALPESGIAVSNCEAFVPGPNATWTNILAATTVADEASQQAQSFSMNVTSLPAGGANYRVYKTTANGNDYWSCTSSSAGNNGTTVPAVSFDRAVKFQFSSGDVEFSTLTLNGEDVAGTEEPVADSGIEFTGVFGGSI